MTNWFYEIIQTLVVQQYKSHTKIINLHRYFMFNINLIHFIASVGSFPDRCALTKLLLTIFVIGDHIDENRIGFVFKSIRGPILNIIIENIS